MVRFSERMKRTVLVAPIDRSTRPVTYGAPVEYKVNVLPTTADTVVQTYGVGYSNTMQIACDRGYGADINEMDSVYVDKTPIEDDPFAENADYYVKSKLVGYRCIVFTLERKVRDDG